MVVDGNQEVPADTG
ncbi:hypothetical protein [Salmonella enterica]